MKLEEYLRTEYSYYIRPLFIKDECELCGTDNNLELHHIQQFSELLKETLQLLHLEYKLDIEDYTKEELQQTSNVILGKQLKCEYLSLCTKCHDRVHKDNLLFTFSNRIKINLEIYKTFKYKVDEKYKNKRLSNDDKLFIINEIAQKYRFPLRLLTWQKAKEVLINNCYDVIVDNKGTFIDRDNNYKMKVQNKEQNQIDNINNIIIPYIESVINTKLLKDEKKKFIINLNIRNNGRIQKSYRKINEWLLGNNIPFIITTKRMIKDDIKQTYWMINKL